MTDTVTVTVRVPADDGGAVFTPEAVAGLVGQRPLLTVGFDWTRAHGRATVCGARLIDDGSIELDLTLAPPTARAVLGPDKVPTVGIGFRAVRGEGEQVVTAADLVELSPAAAPPNTKALVGPLPRVHFRGGPRDLPARDWPFVVYDTPRDTLDPRYRACREHRVACDCREAEFAEERREWQTLRDDIRLAEQLVAGHHEDCACTGCKMIRLMGHAYDPRYSWARQPEPDVALVLRAQDAKQRWHFHRRDAHLPGICEKCRVPFPCRDRRAARVELDDIAEAWPALVELALMYVQPEEQPHVLVYDPDYVDEDDVEQEHPTLTDALEWAVFRRDEWEDVWPLRLERRTEGAATLVLFGDALTARVAETTERTAARLRDDAAPDTTRG